MAPSIIISVPVGLIFYIKDEVIPVPLTKVDIQTKVIKKCNDKFFCTEKVCPWQTLIWR